VLPSKTEWVGEQTSPTSVKYTLTTPELEMVKELTVDPEHYLVKMKVTTKVLAPGDAQQNLAVSVFAVQDPKKIQKGTSQEGPRAWHSSTLIGEEIYHSTVNAVAKAPRQMDNITWTGFEHPYLLAAYAPHHDPGQKVLKRSYIEGDAATGLMRTDIFFGNRTLKSGEVYTREVVGYLGPKFFTALREADDVSGFATNFKQTVDLGWFAFIGKPLLWLLLEFYSFLGNWGLAIILLTFLVKGATIYWTTQSMRSMKAMAGLAPQMKVLQEKYKDDRQRLNVEMQALYKLHKVNPIAGCLPILLQMPIWLALYRMLSAAGELYQQPFIPGWIDDLTASDPFHILPVVLVITMFLQARLTPQTGDSTQQKIMMYGLPLGFGVMSFMFPAGLTLYIFTNTILSALHSIYMNKFDKKSKEIAARMAAAVASATDAKGKAPTKAEKKVIDVADAADDSDDQDESDDSAPAASSGASNPARKNKKKRRRK
jgi:YidC/Oxa1 family membrane protein insertase